MRVLVTGAAGFIGQVTCAQLRARGHDVVGVDALIPQAHRPDTTAGDGVHRVDVRDRSRLAELLDDVDVVSHQAAMVGAGVSTADLPLYASHNDLGTASLLAAMADRHVDALVLASSMVVYGDGGYRCSAHGLVQPHSRSSAALRRGEFEPSCPRCESPLSWVSVDEDTPLRPQTSYAASKVAQEHYATAWAGQADGRALALRYHNVYGPGMPRDTPYSGVAAIFRSALERGLAPRVFEDGRQVRDFVHVADVARANAIAAEHVSTAEPGALRALNICSGTPYTILEAAERLSDTLGGPAPVVTGEWRSGDARHIVASGRRAESVLDFRAEIHPMSGLRELATAGLRPTA